jgi:hypothetical protein
MSVPFVHAEYELAHPRRLPYLTSVTIIFLCGIGVMHQHVKAESSGRCQDDQRVRTSDILHAELRGFFGTLCTLSGSFYVIVSFHQRVGRQSLEEFLKLRAQGDGKNVYENEQFFSVIEEKLIGRVRSLFTLHGRLSKKQLVALIGKLEALPLDAPRVILATGKLVGEGFDHPALDTLVLAMPVSWKGTLQQYAGRLHREHADKADVRIIDFIDSGHPAFLRMWSKRQAGYKAMGYGFADSPSAMELLE